MKRMVGAAGVAAVAGMASGQTCASSFEYASLLGLDGQAAGVALGDLDGDGDLDAVLSLISTDRLVVARNDGSGGFTLEGDYAVAGRPLEAALADADGDGDLDAITACADGFVSVLRNAGDGTLGEAVDIESLPGAQSLSVGDLDGDGHVDLLVGSGSTGELAIMRGDGGGGFGPPVVIAASGGTDTELADFNGDGLADILAAGRGLVTLNQGDGSFVPAAELVAGGIRTVAAGDVDGDGHQDAVLINWQWFWAYVALGNGDGTWRSTRGAESDRRSRRPRPPRPRGACWP